MDSENFDNFKLTLNEQELKKRFSKVYSSVISNYFVFNKELINDAKDILESGKEEQNFKSDLPSYQLAFLLSFGIQDTCLSVQKFHDSIKKYTRIIKILSQNNSLKILCLESESLPTVIGTCQVIDNIVRMYNGARSYSEIRIFVTDQRKDWRLLCGCIVDTVNSYFKNIELKLDFVNWFDLEISKIIRGADIVILARAYAEKLVFTANYYFIMNILHEMKEDAILFHLDCYNEKYYENLKQLISKTNLFFPVNGSKVVNVSFKSLKKEEYNLDLPINWNTSYQHIMFSVWIKDVMFMECMDAIAFNKLISDKLGENSSNPNDSDLSKNATTKKTSEHSSNDNISVTCSETDISKLIKSLPIAKKSDITGKPTVSAKGKMETKSSNPNPSAVEKKQTSSSKEGNESCAINVSSIQNPVLNVPSKKKNGSKTTKSKENPQCLNGSSTIAISQSVISESKNQVSSANAVNVGSSTHLTTKTVVSKKKIKETTSKIPNDSSVDMSTTNKQPENVSKKKENASTSQKLNSEKSKKNKSQLKLTVKNKESKTLNVSLPVIKKVPKKKTVPVQFTKKSVKNGATEKIKMTGKFASMDLEKKNKDERHKMRAKQKSFSKYANFDYDD